MIVGFNRLHGFLLCWETWVGSASRSRDLKEDAEAHPKQDASKDLTKSPIAEELTNARPSTPPLGTNTPRSEVAETALLTKLNMIEDAVAKMAKRFEDAHASSSAEVPPETLNPSSFLQTLSHILNPKTCTKP